MQYSGNLLAVNVSSTAKQGGTYPRSWKGQFFLFTTGAIIPIFQEVARLAVEGTANRLKRRKTDSLSLTLLQYR